MEIKKSTALLGLVGNKFGDKVQSWKVSRAREGNDKCCGYNTI